MDEGCELLTPKICQNNRKQPWESPGSSQFIYPGSCNSRCQCCSWRIQKDLSNLSPLFPNGTWGQLLGKGQSVSGGRGVWAGLGWSCCPQEVPQAGAEQCWSLEGSVPARTRLGGQGAVPADPIDPMESYKC